MITNRNLRQTLEAELTIVAERAMGGGAPDYPLLLLLFSIDRHLTRIARAVEKLAGCPPPAGPPPEQKP